MNLELNEIGGKEIGSLEANAYNLELQCSKILKKIFDSIDEIPEYVSLYDLYIVDFWCYLER